MISLLQQVLSLLETEAGDLTYHLVLAFSIAGALQISLSQNVREPVSRYQRTIFGLVVLLALQIMLFVSAGLVWQGLIDGDIWLPPVDRAVSLLSLLIIVWLWAFPDRSSSGDSAALLLGLLVLTMSALGVVWWSSQGAGLVFNGSLADLVFQISSLVMILVGCIILVARKPEGWGMGFSMLVLIAVGPILHFLLLPYGVDYPNAVRLLQMAAFPFLLTLPQRFQHAGGKVEGEEGSTAIFSRPGGVSSSPNQLFADPQVWQSLLKMAGESDPDKFAKLAVSSLAKIMDTDICLLVMPPDKKGKLKVQVGFDRSSQRYLSEIDLESRGMPLITSSLRMGRTRRVPAASTSPDLGTLANALNIERTGDILFTPVLNPDGSIVSSVILLSPYSARDWSIQDQSFLTSFAKILVYFLQRSREMATLRLDFNQIKSMARQTQEQMQLTAEERQKLRDQVAVLKEEAQQDKAEIARMALTAAALITAQQTIEQLTSENEQLKEAAQQAAQAASLEEQSDGELRMALQEIAFLRDALAEAEEKVESSMLSPRGEIPSDLQFSEIFSVAQDLRQPLSSIAGYTDFLLSESVGLLGAMQRKYLDRIKVSTERMNRLIDDLIQATHKETSPTQRELTNIDLCSVINKAINETDEQMRNKMIALRVNLPDQALNLVTDPQAIRKVFVSLLRNAGSVSPIGGEVMVNARYETAEGERDYILVQVADSGEGIAPQDLPRVLSQRVDGEEISGISDNGLELSQVKTLVEVLGGRAWVDSEIGHGAIYSVLLPVSSGNSESPLIGRD